MIFINKTVSAVLVPATTAKHTLLGAMFHDIQIPNFSRPSTFSETIQGFFSFLKFKGFQGCYPVELHHARIVLIGHN